MKVLYFAWLKEKIGVGEEVVHTSAPTVAALADELAARGAGYAAAFADRAGLRAAVDQEMAEPDAPIADAREVAFFPPVTGG